MNNFLRNLVCRRLADLDHGRLVLMDAAGRQEFGRPESHSLAASIVVHRPRFYRSLVFGGSLGAAEAYIRGDWTCDNLVDLMRIFCRDTTVSAGMEHGPARLLRPMARLGHWLRRNTTAGSRRNIAAHYDLGNEFFALFLDETMAYSCAVFPHPESTLHEASVAKLDHICRKLALNPNDHLLEIGTGWGGFAVHAARNFGCRVTTTTISQKQYDYTRRLVADADLADRVTVLQKDYREMTGTYDKLVSIEMIEAVGHQFFDLYFRTCSQLLKPEGLMLLQAITIPDQRYEAYRRGVDFIQRYIFPGGCLPSVGVICGSVGRRTDMRLLHFEDLTPHYAETLAYWRARFLANLERVRELGFSDEFIRTWEYYFCYCEGAFRERAIGDTQMLLAKPACRTEPVLPPIHAAPFQEPIQRSAR